MAPFALTGSRIRERRLDLGLRQADVAASVGISPSYLNLIEHNRRRIAGKVLNAIAKALDVDAALLSQGADSGLLDQMRAAAAGGLGAPELDRVEECATRYPGWSALIAAQATRIASLENRIEVLNDRMTHDPALATSLHAVISAVTSIRSTASILVGGDRIDADWQGRFHRNIYDDSLRLTASSEALIGHLDAPSAGAGLSSAPRDEVAQLRDAHDHHFADLEKPGAGQPDIDRIVTGSGALTSTASRILARRVLADYLADAQSLPMARLTPLLDPAGHDPAIIAARCGGDLALVMRRLASLPPDGAHPDFGLFVVDAAGGLRILKSAPGFSLPRDGTHCPLWPIFNAFRQPMQPIRAQVSLPGPSETRLLCFAIAQPQASQQFDAPTAFLATMLVWPHGPDLGGPVAKAGLNCRICPRDNCTARFEPSVLHAETSVPAGPRVRML